LLNDSVTSLLVPDILGDKETLSTSSVDELLGLLGVNLFLGEVDDGDLLISDERVR
jgi:hypothetical protein